MENINININLLRNIFNAEAQKLVGKVCKRFELSSDKEDIKKHVKEILYESMRDTMDVIVTCSKSKESITLTPTKSKEQ